VANPADGGRLWSRPLLAGAAVAFDLYKLVAPISLAVQYHYSPQALLAGRWIFYAWTIPAAIAVVLWLVRKRARWLLVAAALFVIPTLPVLGLVPFQFERLSLTADHYLYVSMIGPALALAFGLSLLPRKWLKLAMGISYAGLALLAVRSYVQTGYWQNTQTLFEHELAVNPYSEVAYNNLATLALEQNRPESPKIAEQLARASIRADPNQAEAYVTLGNAMVRQQRELEAFAPYRTAIQNDPNAYPALTSLSALLAQSKQFPEAMRLCARAIQIEPTYEKAHLNMAVMLANQNRLGEAVKEASIAVQLNPADAQAQRTLGLLLKAVARTRQTPDSIQ
jgi:tetratricopeptide (TPR) repeat protein